MLQCISVLRDLTQLNSELNSGGVILGIGRYCRLQRLDLGRAGRLAAKLNLGDQLLVAGILIRQPDIL